jgi:glycosyltransferase involved in cell wall biosynthesis
MGTIASIPRVEDESVTSKREDGDLHRQTQRPLISIVVPAYNEDSLAERHLLLLCTYMNSLEDEYRWEMVIVNDGSTDQTGQLADAFAKDKDNVHVLHHLTNVGVGEAFKSAFHVCQGDYVVTLDLDLSYSPDHIRRLVEKVRTTQAKVVVASPYMKGGRVSNVPWLRRILSRYANRFLASTAKANLSTLTSMVRAYDGKFLRESSAGPV